MEERNIALAEPGSSEVYFRAWGKRAVGAENTIVWSNNSDLLGKGIPELLFEEFLRSVSPLTEAQYEKADLKKLRLV